MRYTKRLGLTGMIFALCVGWNGTVNAEPDLEPIGGMAASVEKILDISNQNEDILEPLATVLVEFPKSSAQADLALNALVDSLSRGPDPAELLTKIMPTIGIRRDTGFQAGGTWRFGSYDERIKLIVYLWSRAESSKEHSIAQRYGRAALLLAAMNDYQFGWSPILLIMRNQDEFGRILELNPSQLEAIQRLGDARKKLDKVWYTAYSNGLDVVNQLILQTTPGASDKVELILHDFDRALQSVPQDGMRWLIINRTWEFLNFEESQSELTSATAIRSQLAKWKLHYKYSVTADWIEQALTTREVYQRGKILTF